MTAVAARPSSASKFVGLIATLSAKNFRIRYRRTALGVVWALLQPVLQALVVAIVFRRVVPNLDTPNYPAYVLSGVMPWALTSRCLTQATTSVVDNASLVRKVATSRFVYPLAAIGGNLAVFAASLVVLLLAAAVNGTLGWHVALLVPALAVQLLVIVGPALLGAALYVTWRDVRFAVESGLLLLFYATPVIYPLSRLGADLAELVRWNPMTGVLSLYRAATLGTAVDVRALAWSAAFGAIAAFAGAALFRRRADVFADLA